MGRIKTDMVKRTARKLVKLYPDKFSKDFNKNKLALKDLAEIRSKKLRNVLAGYAVRLKVLGDELRPKARKKTFSGGPRGSFRGGPRSSYGGRDNRGSSGSSAGRPPARR